MRALVFTAPGVVEMLDVAEPTPGADEIIVTVEATGICGSELHGIRDTAFRKPPLVMGHEFVGLTEDGTRVAVNPLTSCGECDSCRRGQTNLCRKRQLLGVHRPGGFSERVAVPKKQVVALPEAIAWEAASLIEPLANAVHAWGLVASERPLNVGIIGAGTIGLVCVLVAAGASVERLVVADIAGERLAAATRLGATETAARLDGEFDVIFDCVGAEATHADSISHLRPGGTAVWLGLLSADAPFDARDVVRMEKIVRGSFAYTNDEFRTAVDLAPEVDLGWTDSFPLEQGALIFSELVGGRTDIHKAVLRP
jgi:threonine dehydrogenase-like Zn-dependent dehydrogenase